MTAVARTTCRNVGPFRRGPGSVVGMVRIHDSLAKRAVELTTRVPGRVSMYVCGPTVYDVPHVGHGRTAVVYDVIRRYLEWQGNAVTFVGNVTNVEDKIIARAASEGTSERELADRYEQAYWDELDRLGVRRPDDVPRATEFIEPMVELIARARRRPATRTSSRAKACTSRSRPTRGTASCRAAGSTTCSRAPARASRSTSRSAAPSTSRSGRPRSRASPTGTRRGGAAGPGWHIECSAMSLSILGEGFDLHGGGDDLVFPHHENERAQAEAAGHAFATHWIHSGMVMVGGEKMSKSLGNFTTLGDALDRYGAGGVPPRRAPGALPEPDGAHGHRARRRGRGHPAGARTCAGGRPGRAWCPGDPDPATIAAFTRRDGRRLRHAGRGGRGLRRRPRAPTPRSTPATPTSPRRGSARSRSCSACSASRADAAEAADDDDEIDALVRDREAARAGA